MLRVMHADDTPYRLAMGVAAGVFIALTPTVGIQMLIIFPICWCLRANAIVGLPFLFVTNVFTMVPIYMVQYGIGAFVLGRDALKVDDWRQLTADHGNWWAELKYMWHFTWEHIEPLGIGAIATALPAAIASYIAVSWMVKAYRMRKFGSIEVPVHHRVKRRKPAS